MKVLQNTKSRMFFASWVWTHQAETSNVKNNPLCPPSPGLIGKILKPLRQWLENIQVRDRRQAHYLCQLIPAHCPFERDIKLFGKTLFHIPPMCKLNPLYEELVGLRFRALCYLADECGEDVTRYC
ncbi:Mo-dependent nitrogenase C-terminal domain-containing protein [Calothrix rhizosoleniae]|uniref:Mo-dependent nitrogenase C-terminal domain-containing protein n=1 Tax=Calothrix rhizosoleniae TaxID=888997 RepID=UPI000B49FC47|nr:Mo-dependent nitrogenase C-terminal domain-containing protein [Calothrix rhizosoleniae]